MTICSLLQLGLETKATSKTMRYFIGSKSFEFDTACIAYTFEVIRSKGRNNAKITVNGEDYLVNEYVFPVKMIELIKASRVYATKDAIGANTEYFKATEPSVFEVRTKKDSVEEEVKVKLLTPSKVKSYFDRFNEAQDEHTKVDVIPVSFEDHCLFDFKALTNDSGDKIVKFNDSGIFDEEVGYLNGIKSPFSSEYVDDLTPPNEEVISLWLLS